MKKKLYQLSYGELFRFSGRKTKYIMLSRKEVYNGIQITYQDLQGHIYTTQETTKKVVTL